MRLSSTFLFAILGPGLLSGCGHKAGPDSGGANAPVVRVHTPTEREVTDYELFTGRTDAVEYVQLRARVTGYLKSIDKVNLQPGKEVKANKVLFEIDPRPYKAELDRAKSQVLVNEAKQKLAVTQLARGKEISKTPGAISQQELDALAAELDTANASVQVAKANAEVADLNLKFTSVTSPVDGVVGRNLISIGNLVNQDITLLTTIVSMDPMYVYFDVDETTMLRIQKLIREGKMQSVKDGAKTLVEFGLSNEGQAYPHQGALDFVNNQVDGSTGTIQVRGLIDNPKFAKGDTRLLTPGLFVRVRIPIGQPYKALLVPQSALGTDQGKKFVYVVNEKNIVEYRPISTGAQQSDGLQVVEPVSIIRGKEGIRQAEKGEKGEPSLTATDRLIVGGLQRVRSGMTVEPKAAAEERK